MATTTTLLSLTCFILLSSLKIHAQAPGPDLSSGPVNLTAILEKNGQYTTFIRLLTVQTQIATQVENQLNTSTEGMTIFAPTDNAFNNLASGAINDLTTQEQNELVLYHIVPKFYTLSNLLLTSNPVNTQASGQNGVLGLTISGQGNQVNVSTGIVTTPVNNALRQVSPLAVYQVDKVLLPAELFGAKSPTTSPPPPAKSTGSTTNSTAASEPASDNGSGGRSVAMWTVVAGLGLVCMELVF